MTIIDQVEQAIREAGFAAVRRGEHLQVFGTKEDGARLRQVVGIGVRVVRAAVGDNWCVYRHGIRAREAMGDDSDRKETLQPQPVNNTQRGMQQGSLFG